MTILDHKVIYRQRLLEQYKSSVNLLGLIDALIEGQGDLETTLDNMLTERGINTALGAQLDIIGALVGQPREILDAGDAEFFGYTGTTPPPAVDGYGSILDGTLGARYKSINEGVGNIRTLGDDEYRIFIKAKIFTNVRILTREDMLDAFRFIFGDTVFVDITENALMDIDLSITANISAGTQDLISDNDVLPRPAGVQYTIVWV